VRVGINPKVLQQITELETLKAKIGAEMETLGKNLSTLTNQRKVSRLSEERKRCTRNCPHASRSMTAGSMR
jgi:hypothetical protein